MLHNNIPISKDHYSSFTSKNIIRHLCNNPACFNPDHLEVGIGTEGRKQNALDSSTYSKVFKLKASDIPDIRKKYVELKSEGIKTTKAYQLISDLYPVGFGSIRDIILGRTWKDI
jgi:hypothetical protein